MCRRNQQLPRKREVDVTEKGWPGGRGSRAAFGLHPGPGPYSHFDPSVRARGLRSRLGDLPGGPTADEAGCGPPPSMPQVDALARAEDQRFASPARPVRVRLNSALSRTGNAVARRAAARGMACGCRGMVNAGYRQLTCSGPGVRRPASIAAVVGAGMSARDKTPLKTCPWLGSDQLAHSRTLLACNRSEELLENLDVRPSERPELSAVEGRLDIPARKIRSRVDDLLETQADEFTFHAHIPYGVDTPQLREFPNGAPPRRRPREVHVHANDLLSDR
jgi:hypothetical protein